MRYCKKCLTTDLRPNAHFDDECVCIACKYSDQAYNYSPEVNVNRLKHKINNVLKDKEIKSYDCIVGVSGGKDSTRQALWVRERLGMNPLLVCCGYPPLQMTDVGAENLTNLIELDFDLIFVGPAPDTARKLSRKSFFEYGNVCKASEIALFSTVPTLAIDLKIPLIFWGENPALQVGDSAVLGVDEFDGNSLRNLNTLVEGGLNWLLEGLENEAQQLFYQYPTVEEFDLGGVQILYLGPAWDNWSIDVNSFHAATQGLILRPEETHETGDVLGSSMLDEEFTNINMMLKYYKFGFGRATDLANELIRSKKATRQDAIDFVNTFDGVCSDEIIERYCEYINIEVNEFWNEVYKITNSTLFDISEGCRPEPKFIVGEGCR